MTGSVVIRLSGPSALFMYRCLGSITERHGLRLNADLSTSTFEDRLEASVAVPRAQDQREAEATIARYLDWIRLAIDPREDELPPPPLSGPRTRNDRQPPIGASNRRDAISG